MSTRYQNLSSTQELSGSQYGRWGSHYIYGTSNAVCGLTYNLSSDPIVPTLIDSAIEWLKLVQNTDGSFGEILDTYKDPTPARHVKSTASHTAWDAMTLPAHLPNSDEAVSKSNANRVASKTKKRGKGATWSRGGVHRHWTSQILSPGQFIYQQYFLMMALERYLQNLKR